MLEFPFSHLFKTQKQLNLTAKLVITEHLPHLTVDMKVSRIPIATESSFSVDECFTNTEKAFQHYGGDIVYGWLVREWVGICLVLEAYAVLENTDGQRIDPTPKSKPYSTEAKILFIEDAFVGRLLPTDIWSIPKRYYALTKHSKIVKLTQQANLFADQLQQYHHGQTHLYASLLNQYQAISKAVDRLPQCA